MSLIIQGVESGALREIKIREEGNELNSDADFNDYIRLLSDGAYLVTLDNITASRGSIGKLMQNNAAAYRKGIEDFKPGEDLNIRAMVYDNTQLTNIGESNMVRVNSLFASRQGNNVSVSSIRHLENLDPDISHVSWADVDSIAVTQESDIDWNSYMKGKGVPTPLNLAIYDFGTEGDYPSEKLHALNGQFRSIQTDGKGSCKLTYQGNGHRIANLNITNQIGNKETDNKETNVGLFCELDNTGVTDAAVSNLDLVNFTVSGGENAGALAGATKATKLENVRVYNDAAATAVPSKSKDAGPAGEQPSTQPSTLDNATPLNPTSASVVKDNANAASDGESGQSASTTVEGFDKDFEISGSGNVGGLVGTLDGGKAIKCAAAVYVKSSDTNGPTGSAGGLFGTVSGAKSKVENSYSGGHTKDGKYKTTKTEDKYADGKTEVYEAVMDDDAVGRVNVQGATAGGLIGTLSDGTVDNCYSTCSASGTTVGGFVGSSSGTINNSYCAGLVAKEDGTIYIKESEDEVGLFVGNITGGEFGSGEEVNYYLGIVNYIDPNVLKKETEKSAIPAVGSSSVTESQVEAFDKNASTYNTFVSNNTGDSSVSGYPYDNKLVELSDKTEAKEDGKDIYKPKYSLKSVGQKTHYGDWPIYETYVVNKASNSSGDTAG